MAVDELRLGRSDLVITGGADTFNDVSMFVAFSKTPALSPSGDCRPFSDRADGTVLGEGIAMFALKRLSDAERDGNHIYALIRSIGSSSDGRSKEHLRTAARRDKRARCSGRMTTAGYGPDSIELVEGHGTGTAAGDAAEIEGLRAVFEPAANGGRAWCALGSVKSQVGHTKAGGGRGSIVQNRHGAASSNASADHQSGASESGAATRRESVLPEPQAPVPGFREMGPGGAPR